MINSLKIYLFLFIGLNIFTIQHGYTQDKNNLWIVGIGANAIDYFPSHAPNTGNDGGFLNEIFNIEDHWNIGGPQIIVTRYLVKNLSVDGLLSLNQITKYGDVPVDKTTYFGMDINLRYSFIDTTKDFTIFALAGVGYTFAFNSGGTVNFGGGSNYWFTETLGVNFEALYKYNSSKFQLAPHFYYGLSLVFKLNNNKSSGWRNCY